MMQIEILFRGQTRKRGEKITATGNSMPGRWVYGGIFASNNPAAHSIIYGGESPDSQDCNKYAVYSDTICQYIGRRDEAGRRVFTGDIIECRTKDPSGRKLLMVVAFDDRACKFVAQSPKPFEPLIGFDHIDIVKVLGTVYDDPDLLNL